MTSRSSGPEVEHLFMGGVSNDSSISFRSRDPSERASARKSQSLGPRCRAVSRDEDGALCPSTPRSTDRALAQGEGGGASWRGRPGLPRDAFATLC